VLSLVRKMLLIAIWLIPCHALQSQENFDVIIRNARILDGSGNPWYEGDVAILGDRIAAVGDLTTDQASSIIDATGLYLTPGFIDVHSHTSGGLVSEDRSNALPLLAQGITTVFVNPDGGGPVDMVRQREDLLRHGLGINVAQMVPHGSVRGEIIGMQDRLASDEELQQMRELVRKGMEAGAFGLSSGPFYAPGSYSDTRELVELSKVAAVYGGAYSSHIRDEASYSIGLLAAVEEVIEVARGAGLPAVVTHIKALGPTVWGFSKAIVHRIEMARESGLEVYADQYPYPASSTGLSAALVPRWAQAGGGQSLLRRLDDPDTLTMIRYEMIGNLARRGGASRIQFRSYRPEPDLEGQSLETVAQQWEMDPVDAAIRMIQAHPGTGIVSFNMHEDDVRTLMQQTWTMTASDGAYPVWGRGVPHPRAYGTFPRKIRKYVLEDQVVDLASAIRSMTSLPAQVFGVRDRGWIREGAIADITIFDLDTLTDKATFTEPFQLSEGIRYVFVNGKEAFRDGNHTSAMAGRVLTR
jgi:N-acyl-D-amino-acid deacylase